MTHRPTTVDEYIASFPEQTQQRLREMRSVLQKAAPGATENLKWGQPAFSYDWILFQYGAFKNHISLYPTPSVVQALNDQLTEHGYESSGMTIKFPLDAPIPEDLIATIAAQRVTEAKQGVKWMS